MKGVTTAMFRDRPVARLSAALEATKPSSRAAADTFCCVEVETDPRPDRALEAVDFETPAFCATSARVLISIFYGVKGSRAGSSHRGEGDEVGLSVESLVLTRWNAELREPGGSTLSRRLFDTWVCGANGAVIHTTPGHRPLGCGGFG